MEQLVWRYVKNKLTGFKITCTPEEVLIGQFRCNLLTIVRFDDKQDNPRQLVHSGWFDGPVKDGIKAGVSMINVRFGGHKIDGRHL